MLPRANPLASGPWTLVESIPANKVGTPAFRIPHNMGPQDRALPERIIGEHKDSDDWTLANNAQCKALAGIIPKSNDRNASTGRARATTSKPPLVIDENKDRPQHHCGRRLSYGRPEGFIQENTDRNCNSCYQTGRRSVPRGTA
jgi:hypothetical protein